MTVELIILFFAVTLAAAGVQVATAAALVRMPDRGLLGLTAGVVFVYTGLLWLRPASLLVSDAIVLAAAAVIGTAIGSRFRDPAAITAFAIAAAIADILSFTLGPTRSLLEGADRSPGSVVSYLTVSVPAAGATVPVVGLGDLLILTTFVVALRRVGAPPVAGATVPTTGLLIALAIGLALGGAFGIPFMAAAVVTYLHLRPDPLEAAS